MHIETRGGDLVFKLFLNFNIFLIEIGDKKLETQIAIPLTTPLCNI